MDYLSSSQIEKYHNDGFLIVRNIFTREECDELRSVLIEEIEKGKNMLKKSLAASQKKIDRNKIADIPRRIYEGFLQDIAHRNSKFMNLAKDSRLISIIRQIFGSNAKAFNLYSSSSIFKNSDTSSKIFWHQDMSYWQGKTNKLVVWISLNKANKQNGAVQYIPGSQNKAYKHIVKDKNKIPFLEAQDINDSQKVVTEVETGDIIIHGPYVLHGSEKSISGEQRYAILFTYQPSTDSSHLRSGPPELIEPRV